MNKLFLNPFVKLSESKQSFFGLSFLIIGSLLGYLFQARFDGVIDLHFVENITFTQPFLDNIINTSTLTLFLFLLGIYVNPKTRFWDILNTSLIARIPFYLMPFFNISNYMMDITDSLLVSIETPNNQLFETVSPISMIVVFIFALLSLLFLVVFGVLLWNGFKVATNAKSTKSIILFIICILLSEITSKFLIHYLN